jgi:radial spoke head protein 4A
VGLSAEEWFRLSLSLQKLCDTEEGIESPRFWGKVFGRSADYYIVEAKLSDYPDDEEEEEAARQAKAADERREPDEGEEEEEEAELPPSKTEPWGTGANEYVYWAANSWDGPWTRLPKVTPEQIIAARGMRRFLTGSLQAAVFGFPRFPWGEASYLRAQIARITASTALCPKGAFVGDDEEPLIALENEEWRGVRASTLLRGDAWVHYRAKLLQEGRVEAFIDDNAEEEPDDDELTELEREEREMKRALKEKPVPILSPASNDRLVGKDGRPTKRTLWKFHIAHHADQGLKPLAAPAGNVDPDDLPPDVSASQVVASAHSLLWPGAVSLAFNKTHLHVYVGYGLKALNKRYQPSAPAAPQSEWRPSTVPNKKGQLVDPTALQSDALPPPADKRSPEEVEEEEEEERQRLKRLAAEEGEPEEPLPEDEEEDEGKEDDEDEEDE